MKNNPSKELKKKIREETVTGKFMSVFWLTCPDCNKVILVAPVDDMVGLKKWRKQGGKSKSKKLK